MFWGEFDVLGGRGGLVFFWEGGGGWCFGGGGLGIFRWFRWVFFEIFKSFFGVLFGDLGFFCVKKKFFFWVLGLF